jgi:hypothetical protein
VQAGQRGSAIRASAERFKDRSAGLRMSYDSALSTRSSFLSRKPLMQRDIDDDA